MEGEDIVCPICGSSLSLDVAQEHVDSCLGKIEMEEKLKQEESDAKLARQFFETIEQENPSPVPDVESKKEQEEVDAALARALMAELNAKHVSRSYSSRSSHFTGADFAAGGESWPGVQGEYLSYLDTVEVIENVTWERAQVKGFMPMGRSHATVTALEPTKLLVMGGVTHDERPVKENAIMLFDLDSLTWSPFETHGRDIVKVPLLGHAATLFQDNVYVYGGLKKARSTRFLSDMWTLNVKTRQWTLLNTHGQEPKGRAAHGSVLVGNFIYYFGGWLDKDTLCSELIAFDAVHHCWIPFNVAGARPEPCQFPTLVTRSGKIYLFGGTDESSNVRKIAVHVYDVGSHVWTWPFTVTAPPMQERLRFVSAAMVGGNVVVLGDSENFREIAVLNLDTLAWTAPKQILGCMPDKWEFLPLHVVKNRIYALYNDDMHEEAKYEPRHTFNTLYIVTLESFGCLSLQDACLRTVAKNLDDYDEEPLSDYISHFPIPLQQSLLSHLICIDKITPTHLSLFPALTTLSLSSLGKRVTDEWLPPLLRLPSLTSLNLAECSSVSTVGLMLLSALTNLISLDLSQTQVNDDVLFQYMETLVKLDVLWLRDCAGILSLNTEFAIPDTLNPLQLAMVRAMIPFKSNGVLRQLHIDGCEVTDAGVFAVALVIRSLQEISAVGCSLTEIGITKLKEFTSIRKVNWHPALRSSNVGLVTQYQNYDNMGERSDEEDDSEEEEEKREEEEEEEEEETD